MAYSDTIAFTRSEREDKKYTIADAVASARRRLTADGMKNMCVDAICSPRRRDYEEKITLVELNKISDSLYHDSHYFYSGPKLKRPARTHLQW